MRKIIAIYGTLCACLIIYFFVWAYIKGIEIKNEDYWDSRDYVMSQFFKSWTEIIKGSPGLLFPDKRWYDIVKEDSFKLLSEKEQELKAKRYIQDYIKDAPFHLNKGIDIKGIEGWLLGIVQGANRGYINYNELFGELRSSQDKDYWAQYDEQQYQQRVLRRILSYLPTKDYFVALWNETPIVWFGFAILFGVPLLLGQIVFWIRQFIKIDPPAYLFCSSREWVRFSIVFSVLVGACILIYFAKGEWHEYSYYLKYRQHFPEGFFEMNNVNLFQESLFVLLASFFSFLGLWGFVVYKKVIIPEAVGWVNKAINRKRS